MIAFCSELLSVLSNFFPDKTFSNRTVVEKLLETADFGDDFVPQVLGNSLKEQFSESEKTTHNDQVKLLIMHTFCSIVHAQKNSNVYQVFLRK